MDEVVVDRGVSRYGLHMVHVMRAGGPVERMAWAVEDAALVEFLEYEEAELGMWHLQVWWKGKGAENYEGWIR